jgi:ribosome biogenesis GTPase
MQLQFADGIEVAARIKGKSLRPVCGDRVVAEAIEGEPDWLITAIEPRENALERPNQRGAGEVLAANIDCVVVVAAAEPLPDWFIVDRYLCAAEFMRASAAVVYNKSDLPGTQKSEAALQVYRDIGYEVLLTSSATGDNVAVLGAFLHDATSIIVGQSGVGKSSLINLIVPEAAQKTATISGKTGEGKHTTVNSVMLPLRGGGRVIDSPGVRDYAPALPADAKVETGYREIHAVADECRFANCKHLREPSCAVKNEVDEGGIDERRYESYRRLLALQERLNRKRY